MEMLEEEVVVVTVANGTYDLVCRQPNFHILFIPICSFKNPISS